MTGSHFLDFNNICLEPREWPEDLYQRLTSFKPEVPISHQVEEKLSPTMENLTVLIWLQLIQSPSIFGQATVWNWVTLKNVSLNQTRNFTGTWELVGWNTVFSWLRYFAPLSKENEINLQGNSTPLNQLNPNVHYVNRLDVHLSTTIWVHANTYPKTTNSTGQETFKLSTWIIRTQMSLLRRDRKMKRFTRKEPLPKTRLSTCQVSTRKSAQIKVFYEHHPIHQTIDSGAEVSMIRTSFAKYIGAPIKSTTQRALQADGVTHLMSVGDVDLDLKWENHKLHLDALIVNDLDVDVLVGMPFLEKNDIGIQPSKNQVTISDTHYSVSTQGRYSWTNPHTTSTGPYTQVWTYFNSSLARSIPWIKHPQKTPSRIFPHNGAWDRWECNP